MKTSVVIKLVFLSAQEDAREMPVSHTIKVAWEI